MNQYFRLFFMLISTNIILGMEAGGINFLQFQSFDDNKTLQMVLKKSSSTNIIFDDSKAINLRTKNPELKDESYFKSLSNLYQDFGRIQGAFVDSFSKGSLLYSEENADITLKYVGLPNEGDKEQNAVEEIIILTAINGAEKTAEYLKNFDPDRFENKKKISLYDDSMKNGIGTAKKFNDNRKKEGHLILGFLNYPAMQKIGYVLLGAGCVWFAQKLGLTKSCK